MITVIRNYAVLVSIYILECQNKVKLHFCEHDKFHFYVVEQDQQTMKNSYTVCVYVKVNKYACSVHPL